jgi:hypothetical protein
MLNFAAQLIGCMLNWCLFGALCVQVCTSLSKNFRQNTELLIVDWYYVSFPEDRWEVKTVVTLVFLVEFTQTTILTTVCFSLYVYGFGVLESVIVPAHWSGWIAIITLTTLGQSLIVSDHHISCSYYLYRTATWLVQMLYAYRIYLLSKAKGLSFCVTVVSHMC